MTDKKRRKPLGERLRASLEESIAHTRGQVTLNTLEVTLADPPEVDAKTMAALRKKTGLSQAVFARMLSVSTKTVQAWEQGARKPSKAVRRLIEVMVKQPKAFGRAVGMPEFDLSDFKLTAKKAQRKPAAVGKSPSGSSKRKLRASKTQRKVSKRKAKA